MKHEWYIVGQIGINERIGYTAYQCSKCKAVRIHMDQQELPLESGCGIIETLEKSVKIVLDLEKADFEDIVPHLGCTDSKPGEPIGKHFSGCDHGHTGYEKLLDALNKGLKEVSQQKQNK